MSEYVADFEGVSYLQTPPPMPKDTEPPKAAASAQTSYSTASQTGSTVRRMGRDEEPDEPAVGAIGPMAAPVAARATWVLMVLGPGGLLILGAFLLGLGVGGEFGEVGLLVALGTVFLVAGLWLLSTFRRAVYFRGTATIRLRAPH